MGDKRDTVRFFGLQNGSKVTARARLSPTGYKPGTPCLGCMCFRTTNFRSRRVALRVVTFADADVDGGRPARAGPADAEFD